ncbi:CHASE domain-containing protein [bacterium]|nr:CHASE domain-containing protein [bacterium]
MQAEFDLGARDRMLAVQREFSEDLAALSALSAFYAASERVERAEFRAFVADTLARRPSIRALEWEPRLSTDRRAAHEAATRAEGFPDYMIRDLAPSGELVPAATREEYFPVWYVEPFQGNENVMGFDPTSEPRRKAALERARDTGRPVASEPITLVQRTHRTTGMLVYLAVYDEPETPEAVRTTAWRREHLAGMVVMVAGIPAAVEGALARFSRGGLRLELWDATETPARLIYCQPLETGQEVVPEVATETEFTLAERRWRLAATATRGFVAARRGRGPEAGLAVGCALTLLLAAFLANLVGRSQRVERLVAERTASLAAEVAERRRIAEVLSLRDRAIAAAANGIVICDARRPDLPILDVNPAFEAITGYAKADVLGRNCRFLQGEDRDQPALTFVRRALSKGATAASRCATIAPTDASLERPASLPIRDAEGRLTHYVGCRTTSPSGCAPRRRSTKPTAASTACWRRPPRSPSSPPTRAA